MITKAQQRALYAVFMRDSKETRDITYLQFRRTAYTWFGDCLMVPWCGMVLGIETDGYTHS